jgi:hypothetical protein
MVVLKTIAMAVLGALLAFYLIQSIIINYHVGPGLMKAAHLAEQLLGGEK